MDQIEHAKLLAALLGVLKKENSKIKDDLLKELHDELDNMTGTKYVQIDEQSEPVPVTVVKGDKGDPGLSGKDGKDGRDGAPGKDGERGARGQKGPRGLQGPQGKEGQPGQPGKDGKDGLDGKTPDIKPIEDRLQKLYNTFTGQVSSQITRMAYTKNLGGGSSPGSGEVRLLNLDDVNRDTVDDGKYLRYNANTELFEFVAAFNSTHFRYLTGTIFANQIANNDINVSKFINDANYANTTYVDTAVANLVDSAPEALDTIWELADALNNNPNFGAEVINSLSQKANTSSIAAVGFSGSYSDLSDTPVFANLTSNLVPSANATYDLGTDSLRWRTLYLSGNTINLGNAVLQSSGTTLNLPEGSTLNNQNIQNLIDDRIQVANASQTFVTKSTALSTNNALLSLINDRIQVANVLPYLPANTSTSNAALSDSTITFTRADSSTYSLDVSSIQGEVSNSYLTSTYVANTALQSYIANTNPRFAKYLQVANSTNFLTGANNTGGGVTFTSNSIINNTIQYKTFRAGENVSISTNLANTEIIITASGGSLSGDFDYGLITTPVDSTLDYGLLT